MSRVMKERMEKFFIGNTLRKLRKDKHLTQSALAAAANLQQGFISDLEHNRKEPGARTLVLLASALQVSVSALLASGNETNPCSITGPVTLLELAGGRFALTDSQHAIWTLEDDAFCQRSIMPHPESRVVFHGGLSTALQWWVEHKR